MIKKLDKNKIRLVRHARVRSKISGTASRPRLCVYRSNKHIYVQIIDDLAGVTLASSSTLDPEVKGMAEGKTKSEIAKVVGESAAARAVQKGILQVVFDRGGYIYHGRVMAVAEGARSGGLKF